MALPTTPYPFDTELVARQMEFLNKALEAETNGLILAIVAVPIALPEKVFVVGNVEPAILSRLFHELATAPVGMVKALKPTTTN